MMLRRSSVCILVILVAYRSVLVSGGGTVGVAYGTLGNNLPPPAQVVQLMQASGIKNAMVYDTNPEVMEAFMGSGIRLSVQVVNGELQTLASDPDIAQQWVQTRILPFASTIDYISVGNEVLTTERDKSSFLYPAMINIHSALAAFDIDNAVKVSTTHAANVLDASNSFPPSNGQFNVSVLQYMVPILGFLSSTGAPFMANVYPFLAYISGNGDIKLPYALLDSIGAPEYYVADAGSGLVYTNLFDAQIDTLVFALEKVGFGTLPLMVTETGWPSAGGLEATTVVNAQKYNNNVVAHVLGGGGTPKRPAVPLQVFIFALFNENQKTGPDYEQHFGLFYPDQSRVYNLALRSN